MNNLIPVPLDQRNFAEEMELATTVDTLRLIFIDAAMWAKMYHEDEKFIKEVVDAFKRIALANKARILKNPAAVFSEEGAAQKKAAFVK